MVVVAAGASACSQTGDSGPGSPVTPTPMSAPTDTPVPTTPHSLNKTPMSESTPTYVPTDIPVPRRTESPTPTPTPVLAATQTPTTTMAPNPTSTAKEVAATRLSGIIPWFANPPDATHVKAADVIGRIWLRDTETGDATARLTWVADGILPEELSPLRAIFLISGYYTELGKRLVETTWFADGVTDDEMGVLTVVVSYVRRWDSESATLLLESAWVADGITREDRIAAATIDSISFFHREFGRRLLSAPLVAGGLNNDELTAVNLGLVLYCDKRPGIGDLAACLFMDCRWDYYRGSIYVKDHRPHLCERPRVWETASGIFVGC